MNSVINSVLSRVLSQEIALQEKWKENDIKMLGNSERDKVISEILNFMKNENIEFRNDFYTEAKIR